MNAAKCPGLEKCYKVKIIMDKDLLDFQYAEAIEKVCTSCISTRYENLNSDVPPRQKVAA